MENMDDCEPWERKILEEGKGMSGPCFCGTKRNARLGNYRSLLEEKGSCSHDDDELSVSEKKNWKMKT